MGSLIGKRALVTGSSQGIGLATVKALLQAGCDVVAHRFSPGDAPADVQAAATASGRRLVTLRGDLTKEAEAEAMVAEAVGALGGLDILINNAGSLIARHPIGEIDAAFWRESVDLNLTSALAVTRAATPALLAAGASAIVNLSSLAGRKGGHGGSLAYATMKGALLTFTRALSAELGPMGVRVNAVAPGLILGTTFHARHSTQGSIDATIAVIPLARAGTPEDVARAIVFLASEYDGFITGATLDINGGIYCA
jgi:3-oxoacyl-[acyl-carrier protein] reductase